ncbi:hypothetical protein HK096_010639, partial [Nowakowskiella sp. JEL0078]
DHNITLTTSNSSGTMSINPDVSSFIASNPEQPIQTRDLPTSINAIQMLLQSFQQHRNRLGLPLSMTDSAILLERLITQLQMESMTHSGPPPASKAFIAGLETVSYTATN